MLPNQKPVATTVLLDDFELAMADAPAETESRCRNLAADPDFEVLQPGRIAPPWNFASMGRTNISAGIGGTEADRWITLRGPSGTTNFESAQLWQDLELRRGVRYDISCRMRWDDFAPDVRSEGRKSASPASAVRPSPRGENVGGGATTAVIRRTLGC